MPLILGTNSIKDTGYNVDNSLRFDGGNSDHLTRTPSSTGNRRTFTMSLWIKRSKITDNYPIMFKQVTDGSNFTQFYIDNQDQLTFYIENGSGSGYTSFQNCNILLRDPSAWYHVMASVDTTQASADNRVKIYVNGVQQTSFNTNTQINQNIDVAAINTTGAFGIGYASNNNSQHWNGYMAEVVFVDGTALSPTDLGEFDEDSPNIWKPKDVSGLTFGTNGFYLDFENASSLGADVSGNGNNFTVNNLTSIDQTTDTPSNNFSTLNPLNGSGTRTSNDNYSEGNTIMIPASHDNYTTTFATMGAKKGKWYWEAQSIVEGTASNAYYPRTIGFMRDDYGLDKSTLGQDDDKTWDVVYNGGNWDASHNNSVVVNDMSTDRTSGNILNFALDLDNGKFYFGINGTYLNSGNPTSGSSGTGSLHTLDATDLSHFIIPAVTNATTGTYYKFNFGNPAFSISSGNADGNGYGNFEYAPPSGYYAWCTKNLAEFG